MKNLWAIALALLIAISLSAAPVLIESYQEGTITIPGDKMDTVTVVELAFSVDTACYVQFTAGGLAQFLTMMLLEFDANYLLPVAIVQGNRSLSALIVYTYLITPGEHTIRFRGARIGGDAATFRKAYLQALIFLPDAPGAVAEQPTSDAEPLPNTPSVISKGPFVHAPGATELVDATGRVIENVIENDKVYLSNLPTGTYFARNGKRTVVKIVKVE
ncbi:T9SS type A sorting domain-containing protein [candidate division WOR-3 bacterium]|nr:T9SS type A sorting domain-containing protein [candidate division WOR-3 bacterium]